MKRFTVSFILACTILGSAVSHASAPTSVYYNNKIVDFGSSPQIIEGTTMVPVRGLSDAIGTGCTWDDETKTVVLSNEKITVWIQEGNGAVAYLKDNVMSSRRMDTLPCIIDNKIYVPLRAVSEFFEIDVSWDGRKNAVILSNGDVSAIPPKAPEIILPENKIPVETVPPVQNVSSIAIADFTPPVGLSKGSTYILRGSINSLNPLNRVNVKITDKATGAIEVNETCFNLTSNTFSLATIDNRIRFGLLNIGEKILSITAVDNTEARNSFTYEFNVGYPQGVKMDDNIRMLWPVPASGLITTIFWCDNPFCHSNAGRPNGHSALDIAAPAGSEVIAVADGVVKLQGFGSYENAKTGYGNFVLLDHGNGVETQYSHLLEIKVKDGEQVKAGQVIGLVGSTGNSSGNHLDFYISKNGKKCDPLYYLDMHPEARVQEECDKKFFDKAMAERNLK